jgi:hypothetical protein
VIDKSDILAAAANDLAAGAKVIGQAGTSRLETSNYADSSRSEIKAQLGNVKDEVMIVGPPL